MIPVRTLTNTLSKLLAADAATLAEAGGTAVFLVGANFTPSIDLVAADIVRVTNLALLPKVPTPGTQNDSVDPVTGELIVEMKEPAGGFSWNTGVGFVGPVTAWGVALYNGGVTVLLGTQKFDQPILLNGDNQSVNVGSIQFRIDPTKIR